MEVLKELAVPLISCLVIWASRKLSDYTFIFDNFLNTFFQNFFDRATEVFNGYSAPYISTPQHHRVLETVSYRFRERKN